MFQILLLYVAFYLIKKTIFKGLNDFDVHCIDKQFSMFGHLMMGIESFAKDSILYS